MSNNFFINFMGQLKFKNALPSDVSTTDNNTQIDVVFSNFNNILAGVYETYFSDHKPIYAIFVEKDTDDDNNSISLDLDHSDTLFNPSITSKDSNMNINRSPVVSAFTLKSLDETTDEMEDMSECASVSESVPTLPLPARNTFIRGLSNNDQVSCYANATIQFLYSSNEFRNVIKTSNDIHVELKRHLEKYEVLPINTGLDCMSLRQASHDRNRFVAREQQDSEEFFSDLLMNNTGIQLMVEHFYVDYVSCQTCGYSNRGLETTDIVIRIPVVQNSTTLEQLIFQKLNREEVIQDLICPTRCGGLIRKQEIMRTSRLLVLQFLIFNNALQKIAAPKLDNVPESVITIAEKTYRPIAGIFHHGDNLSRGHYTCMIKSNNSWFRANDSNIQQANWPIDSKNLYMLLLETV